MRRRPAGAAPGGSPAGAGRGVRLAALALAALLVALAAAGCSRRARDFEQVAPGERLVLRFGHGDLETSVKGMAARRVADLIQERSAGRVEVQVFPGGSLFAASEELGALSLGQVDLIAPGTADLATLSPVWQVFDLPFAFASAAAAERVMASEAGQAWYADLEQRGMVPLGFWPLGFRSLSSNRWPIQKPGHLAGISLAPGGRVSEVTADFYAALGARLLPAPAEPLYSVLGHFQADAYEGTLTEIYAQRLHEVQRFLTVTGHAFSGSVVLVNGRLWHGLSPELRELIREAVADVTQWLREQVPALHAASWQRIDAARKVQIFVPDRAAQAEWRAAAAPVYRKAAERLGADLLDRVVQVAGQQ